MKRAASSFALLALLFGGASQVKADAFFIGTIYQTTDHTIYGETAPTTGPGSTDPVVKAAYDATLGMQTALNTDVANGLVASAMFKSSTIDFSSSDPNYTSASFFNNPTFFNLMNNFQSAANFNNTYVVLTGQVYLTAGEVVNLLHDDGARAQFSLASHPSTHFTIGTASPTSAVTDSSDPVGTAGIYNLTLSYGEVNGAPGVLQLTEGPNLLPLTAVPEPSSIAMAAIGLATFGLYRLRRRKPVAA